MEGITLEIKDCVHDVLEHLRAGDRAFFGDVSDQEDGDAVLLGPPLEPGSTLSHLADVASGRREILCVRRLDGVDDYGLQRVAHGLGPGQDGADFGFRQEVEWVSLDAQSIRSHLDLLWRFLP